MPESEGAQSPDEKAQVEAALREAVAEAEAAGAPVSDGAGAGTVAAGEVPPGTDPAAATATSPGPAAPDDADDLRGYHFKRLMAKPLTNVLVFGLAALVGVVLVATVAPVIGGAAFVVAIVAGLVVVFIVADNQAASAFFTAYASEHSLELGGKAPLPPSTPLLRKGDDRYAERTLSGPMGEGVEGILALYTYEDEYRDSDGNKQTNYYHYTVGLTPVPECAAHVPELLCQRKFGLRSLEKVEDAFRGKKKRVKLESEALDRKYEIFTGDDQDEVWLRRLFSPVFIVWLTESAPEKFAFELVKGNLCCYVSGHKESAAALDQMRAATAAVAQRLREESEQTSAAGA